MLSFEDFYYLNEGVDVQVPGWEEDNDHWPRGVLDVIHKMQRFLWYKTRWGKEAPEWLGDINSWSPDTSHHSYNDPIGTINWYPPEDVPPKAQKEIIDTYTEGIKKFGYADVVNIRHEKSNSTDGMVWRVDIEVVNKEVNEPPMGPHMSYPSADLIFGDLFDAEAIIDKEAGVIGYTISPLDIMTRLSGMSDSDIEAALEKTPETGWKGNVHHQRREVGDILSWIRSIEDIAMWAIDNGHDEIKVI